MYLDLLFVKAVVGDALQVGYYSAAATVAQAPDYALLPLVDTLLPVTSRLLNLGRRDEARHKIATGLRYGLMLLAPAAILISVTARSLMILTYSKTYAGAGAPPDPDLGPDLLWLL